MEKFSVMNMTRTLRSLAVAVGLVLSAASPVRPDPPDLESSAAKVPPSALPKAVPLPDRETWDILTLQGARVGHAHTVMRNVMEAGRKFVKIEVTSHLVIKRFGQTSKQNIRYTGTETPDGKLIEYTAEIQQGPIPMLTTGRVVEDKLEVVTTTLGKKTARSIPWSPDDGGFYAAEQTMLYRPMKPGERRFVRALEPTFNQVITHDMVAKDYEPVDLLGGKYNLLRIDSAMRLPGGVILETTIWTNQAGETMKTLLEAMDIETIRSTKELALDETDLLKVDLGTDAAVKIDEPLSRAHDTRRVRYTVRLEGSDPAEVFASGASQQVKSTGKETAELTVYALRPGRPDGNPDAADDPPTDDDRQPNNFVQSDHEKIVAMAKEAAGDETDPWQVALKLERYVNETITEKNFSQAFATAAEVAEDPTGDCSEHAVLLIALARARGIPARAAVGLVYMQGRQAFGYHMWTEVYVQRRWIPLDATLAQGGIGAAHLKLAHSNLKGASAYTSFLPVMRVIGRLKVEIDEVE